MSLFNVTFNFRLPETCLIYSDTRTCSEMSATLWASQGPNMKMTQTDMSSLMGRVLDLHCRSWKPAAGRISRYHGYILAIAPLWLTPGLFNGWQGKRAKEGMKWFRKDEGTTAREKQRSSETACLWFWVWAVSSPQDGNYWPDWFQAGCPCPHYSPLVLTVLTLVTPVSHHSNHITITLLN